MRIKILVVLILFSVNSCINSKTDNIIDDKKTHDNDIDSILNSIIGNQDTIIISTENNDTLSYTKEELKDILEYYPEINDKYPKHPDLVYAISTNKFIDNKEFDSGQFGSECGQDCYYILYSFFLKHRNGDEIYNGKRDTLIQIYRKINGINEGLANGGTYFGHQHDRILGYTEYSIYKYKNNNIYFNKEYDIENQKEIFLKLLRQRIIDEESKNFEYDKTQILDRKLKFKKYTTKLDSLITDYFYLKMAQEFQYSNY